MNELKNLIKPSSKIKGSGLIKNKIQSPEPKQTFHTTDAHKRKKLTQEDKFTEADKVMMEEIGKKSTTVRLHTDTTFRCNAMMNLMGVRSYNDLIMLLIENQEDDMSDDEKRAYELSIKSYYKQALNKLNK